MNKPKIVSFTSIVLVVLAFISMFGASGRTSSRSASALARDLLFIEPTPTIPYTPEAFIPVRMSALNSRGAAREELLCATPDYSMYYGCTAFCRDDDPAADEKCNREQKLAYPYGTESVPRLGVENDYLPDVLTQEMGSDYENAALRAGAITMRSFALQQFEELNFQGKVLNNSTQYQAFIPYKFDTLNSDFPGSTCGLPDPLINDKQKKICEAVAPRYYISFIEKGDYPAQANHFADVPYRTDDASDDDPALVSVEDPISTEEEPCIAWQESVSTYGLSQKGANRWARGNRCGVDTPGEPWSVQWTTAEQILFHYFTGVQLRDADNDKKIVSPDWRWNPLAINWGTQDRRGDTTVPVLQPGTAYPLAITLQNTGISSWPCRAAEAEQMPIPPPAPSPTVTVCPGC